MVTVWRIRSNYHGVIRRVPYTTEAQGAVCCRVVCRLLHSGALLRRTGKIGAVLPSLVQLFARRFVKHVVSFKIPFNGCWFVILQQN